MGLWDLEIIAFCCYLHVTQHRNLYAIGVVKHFIFAFFGSTTKRCIVRITKWTCWSDFNTCIYGIGWIIIKAINRCTSCPLLNQKIENGNQGNTDQWMSASIGPHFIFSSHLGTGCGLHNDREKVLMRAQVHKLEHGQGCGHGGIWRGWK